MTFYYSLFFDYFIIIIGDKIVCETEEENWL